MTLFDTHAHYDDEAFDADRDAVLAAFDGLVIDPGCTLASSQAAVDLTARYPHVYAAVGIHPENCGDFVPEHMDALRQLAREPKVVAIGEIGLDYYWPENPPRDFQQQVFRAQLELALELDLHIQSSDAGKGICNILLLGAQLGSIVQMPQAAAAAGACHGTIHRDTVRRRSEHLVQNTEGVALAVLNDAHPGFVAGGGTGNKHGLTVGTVCYAAAIAGKTLYAQGENLIFL